MSKKIYVQVAEKLRSEMELAVAADNISGIFLLEKVTSDLADLFAADNERFDRERFRAAVRGGLVSTRTDPELP